MIKKNTETEKNKKILISIRLDETTIEYFKKLAKQSGIKKGNYHFLSGTRKIPL